jgi:hypothetical protein
MSYNYNNFLRQISPGDRNIQVLDSAGVVKYTINPFSIINVMVSNNLVKINLKNDKIIILDFYSAVQAKSAIVQLQGHIDTLAQKVPFLIDKNIENYIQDQNSQILGNFDNISYNDLLDKPFTLDGLGRIDTNKEMVMNDAHIYMNGEYSLRFTNYGSATQSDNQLIRVWSNDGPLLNAPTQSENTDYERVQISYNRETDYNSSLSLKTFDWTGGTSSSIQYDWKFYNGNIILPNDGDVLMNGQSIITRFLGTSSTEFQVPDVGVVVNLTTQPKLTFTPMQSLLVYANLINNYMVDDYVEGDYSSLFIGSIDSYDRETGHLSLVVDYQEGYGLTTSSNIVPTYSYWNINLTGKYIQTSGGSGVITGATSGGILTSDGTTTGINASSNIIYDGTTLAISATTQFQQTIELVNSDATYVIAASPSTIEYDFTLGGVWYHNDLNTDYLASFINVPENTDRAITVTIIVAQGSTAYLPVTVAINGVIQTIKWSNATPPTGTPNQTDIIGLSFINIGGTFVEILGNISTFG